MFAMFLIYSSIVVGFALFCYAAWRLTCLIGDHFSKHDAKLPCALRERFWVFSQASGSNEFGMTSFRFSADTRERAVHDAEMMFYKLSSYQIFDSHTGVVYDRNGNDIAVPNVHAERPHGY